MLLAEVFQKGPTEQHRHLNRNKNQEIHRNSLNNFLLQGLDKHIHWFRCGGKEKHLNPASRLNQTANPLTTNALQDFQQPCPRFRSQAGMECHRPQMCLGGTSEKGIPERTNRTAHASEPERKTRNPPQHIEKLYLAQFWQASPLVQMRRKREASEPCIKAKCNSQLFHNKRIAGFSATVPVVQIPTGFGCHRLQMCPGGASGRGIHQTRSRTAQASEPERNTRNPPQHIEKLSIARV